MTQKQFDICVQNNIPIYKIWVKDKFHKQKIPYEQLSGVVCWINTTIPYSTALHCDIMYVSGDKLEKGIEKLFKYLETEETRKMQEAKKKLDYLKQVRKEIKAGGN